MLDNTINFGEMYIDWENHVAFDQISKITHVDVITHKYMADPHMDLEFIKEHQKEFYAFCRSKAEEKIKEQMPFIPANASIEDLEDLRKILKDRIRAKKLEKWPM